MQEVEALFLEKKLKWFFRGNRTYRPNLHCMIDSAGDRTFEAHWSPRTGKKVNHDLRFTR